MNIVSEIFGMGGRPKPAPRLEAAPSGVKWRFVRPRGDAKPVRAELAREDGEFKSDDGVLHYRAGEHYLVDYGDGDPAPVRRDIFERTYKQDDDGRYSKRTDVVLRYFTLNRPVVIETLEGPRRADAGDWIMVGVAGEMWPQPAREARRKYETA